MMGLLDKASAGRKLKDTTVSAGLVPEDTQKKKH
jgi:hypothetical protein